MPAQDLIRFYRGDFANLPLLLAGEPAFCIDTGELYIGDGVSNVPIGRVRVGQGNYGDISVDVLGTTWTVNDDVITSAKMANIPAKTLLGNWLNVIGAVAPITMAQALENFSSINCAVPMRTFYGWFPVYPSGENQSLETTLTAGQLTGFWKTRAVTVINETQPSGTNGGTFTAGSWQMRTLNTIAQQTNSKVSLASNLISLGFGQYKIRAEAPAANCANHQAQLYDVTNGAVLATGSNAYAIVSGAVTRSIVEAYIEVPAPIYVALRHQCQTTAGTYGYGAACGFGPEVYSTVSIETVY
jgi:hypothetical protein